MSKCYNSLNILYLGKEKEIHKNVQLAIIYFAPSPPPLKIENCTISIPRGNSYCRRKSSAKDLGLKSHPMDGKGDSIGGR